MPEVKRIDSNNSKIKHTDELRAHLLDEGNKIPYSVFGTDTTRTEIISQADGTGEIINVGFTDRSGRPQAFGNDVTDYVQALESALDETLNDGDFIDGLNTEVFPVSSAHLLLYRLRLTVRP